MQQPAKHERPLFPGELMAFYRKQRGWTQAGLAMRLYRSVQWVKAIESGRQPLDSLRTLAEVAEVLGVPVSALLGKPIAPPPVTPELPDPHGMLLQLRYLLEHYNGLHGFDRPEGSPRPLAELAAAWRQAGHLWRQEPANLSSVLRLLPGLLREARQAVEHAQEGSADRRAAWRVLAGLYRLTECILWQYGDDQLAYLAADRAIRAGEQADDPLVIAAGARAMQQVKLAQGRYAEVIELAERAGRLLTPGRDPRPEQLTVWGSLHMIAAFAAARAQDRAEYQRLQRLTDAAAEQLGEDRTDYSLDFGPAMAAIQRVGELAELYEPKRAIELAERLPADPLPNVDRRYFHRVHQARARFLRRQDDSALGLLVEADRVAPEISPYEPMAREMLRAILRRRRTPVPAAVRALAVRLRVLPA